MAKRRREQSSDGTTPTAAEPAYNTVFIDTSLDTHLAMLVSYCDTVSDFKEKIMLEHMQCFPKFGKIKIQSLKVKRRGNFYHLPDFMLVRNETGNLLSIKYPHGDGQSILPDDSPKILPPIRESKSQKVPTADLSLPSRHGREVSEDAEMDVSNRADYHCGDLYSDANRTSALKMLPSDGNGEANVVSEMTSGLKVDEKTVDVQCNNSVEQSLRTGSPPKKKHKRRHDEDGSHGPAFEHDRTGVRASMKDTISRSEISGSGNSFVVIPESGDAQHRKHNLLEATAALSGVQIEQFQNEVGDVFDKSSQLKSSAVKMYKVGNNESTENHLESGNRKEDSMLESVIPVPENSMVEKQEMLGSNVATAHVEGNASRPSLSREKRKKKRRENPTDNYTHQHHHSLHESAPEVNHKETDQTDMEENQREFSLNHDPEAMQSKKLGPKDQGEAGGNIRVSVQPDKLSDACGEREHDSGRKRRSKKSSANSHHETDVKHSNDATSLTGSDVPNLELSNTKNENILTPSETGQTYEIEERNLLVNHELIKVLCKEDVSIKEPNLSAKLLDANGAIETTNSCGIKRKKKKRAQKSAAKIQDAPDMEHGAEKTESMENYSGTLQCKNTEQESGLSINHDPEAMLPSNSDSVVCDKSDITLKETIFTEKLLDTKTVVEPGSSEGSRKKRSVKKSAPPNLEASGMEHFSKEGVHGASSDEKRQSISFNKVKDVIKRKSLKGYAGYSLEEVDNANGNKGNLLPLAQTGGTRQSTEVTDDKLTEVEGKNLSPADSCLGHLPLNEQEKQVKSSQLDRVYKNQENRGPVEKKDKKKIKKKQLTASKDHENSPTKYQVGDKDLTASNDELRTTCNPSEAAKVRLNRASPSNQWAVSEMEVEKEKLKGMPETDLLTDNLVNNFEIEDEGINFKSYFVPSQQQDKVASSGGIENINQIKSEDED
ncbi:uncharacterized protein Fot_04635 [Forsythia ovata]|uniref:Uncharacterized protein n=1 Tax=Forsythia ovata TaxID=205694 RepID=A0ABD1XDQ2_9LAMI